MALRLSFFLNILLYTSTLEAHTISTAQLTYFDSKCSNTMIFAPNSTYQTNLNSVFLSLTSKAATAIAGNSTNNAVYGLFLCREDITTGSCKNCVEAATVDLSQSYCPLKKVGVIWYKECMVRYSNESFFGKLADSPRVIIWNSRKIAGNQTQFTENLRNAMTDLAVHAGSDVSDNTFYRKDKKITGFLSLKMFSQCTADLTESDCTRCLGIAVAQLPVTSVTGMVLQPSCNVWYEIYESNTMQQSNSKIRTRSGNEKLLTKLMVATTVPVASVIAAILALCVIITKRNKTAVRVRPARNPRTSKANVDEGSINFEVLRYDLRTLRRATDDFSEYNKLGIGGFGTVFKGILSDGVEIAVKRMSRHGNQGDEEFKNEVLSLAKLQHRNLVKLLGFCLDGDERLLVYEYMPYDLSHILFDNTRKRQLDSFVLDWRSRFHIIKGIAKGLLYLHQDSRLRVGHRDVKPKHVLLDEHMNPKITDFGLARIFHGDHGKVGSGRVTGTIGYLCPEYIINGHFSIESDVHSYGVLILEIISGTKNFDFVHSQYNSYKGYSEYLHAREQWRDERVLEFLDEAIGAESSISKDEIERCISLGWLCVQKLKKDRPTMATVVLMLETQSVTLPMPEQPAYMSYEESNSTIVPESSINYASITTLEVR